MFYFEILTLNKNKKKGNFAKMIISVGDNLKGLINDYHIEFIKYL